MSDAWEFEFYLRDDEDNLILHRTIEFPYAIDSKLIDDRIGGVFIQIATEKDEEESKPN